ncbi:MAG: thiamine pyrophosphate-binding protein [Clostridia bacterium]|nr:thiamine pyrophosphate-binding protein [Clostridia bacterium]
MKISEAILKYLKENGVECIFGIPAGTVSPIFDSMNNIDIELIITKNEAGAAYSAARYASMSKQLGVCIGAGGVGVNNMVNGIADAMRAKAPVLVITGYVNRWQIGKGAIQELDTKDILKPITKYSNTILYEEMVPGELKKAIELALTPPMGPVHICIPVDIQGAQLPVEMPEKVDIARVRQIQFNRHSLQKALDIINNEKYGIIMVGKGCRGMSEKVMKLSEHLQWPIITTPEGKGVVHSDFYLNLGNYGFAGTDAADEYVEKGPATCILILGTSLGEPSTYNFNQMLVKGKKVIHVDWDIRELGKVFETDAKIHGDLEYVLTEIIRNCRKSNMIFNRPELNKQYECNHTGLSLRLFLEQITRILPMDTRYVCDIGEYTNFVFKYLSIPEGGDFEVNINYGAMGSAIAGSLGAYMADAKKPLSIFAGDGSFFMNGAEVLTAKEYKLPIIYIISNNAMLGYVDRGHSFLYGRTLRGFRQERISIADMMRSVGVKSMQIRCLDDMKYISTFIEKADGPCVIELITDGSEPAPILDRLKALRKSTA